MDIKEAKEFIRGKKVFLTGATGFVGGHLARELLKCGASLTLLVRPTSNKEVVNEFIAKGATIVEGDITDKESVTKAAQGAEIVFHIAALFREAKHADDVYFKVNLEGSKNVFDAAEQFKAQRIVYCSTTGVYGDIEQPPANEDYRYAPRDVYQVSKTEAEKEFFARCKAGRVNGVVIRPAMIWGEGDKRFLKMFRGIARRRFPIIGNGKTWTHWIYITDLVNAFILAALVPGIEGRSYIIAGEPPVEFERVVNAIAHEAGVKPLPFKIPVLPVYMLGALCELICVPFGIEPPIFRRRVEFFTKNRCFDVRRSREELNFHPEGVFEDEVKKLYTWYKTQGWI